MNAGNVALSGEDSGQGGSDGGPVALPPSLPQVQVRSSLFSGELWLTSIVSLGLGYAVIKGWLAPRDVDSTQSAAVALIHGLINGQNVALITILGTVLKFITSRGKLKSNAAWATASMNNPFVKNDNLVGESHAAGLLTAQPLMAQGLLGGSRISDILGAIGGGGGAKDPNTWKGLANIVGQIAGGKAGKTITSITGITGQGGDAEFQAQVLAGFQALADRAKLEEAAIVGLWNSARPSPRATTVQDVLDFIKAGV